MDRRIFLLSSLLSCGAIAKQANAPIAFGRVILGDVGYDGLPDVHSIHSYAMSIFDYEAEKDRADVWQTSQEIKDQIESTGRFCGDCEDFATYCVSAGQSVGLDIRHEMCLTERLEGHIVASYGNLVMCCRQNRVMFRDELAYHWIKRDTGNGWVYSSSP